MTRPLLLDLFSCAGGAAMGYHRAGFDVVGVDVEPQPNYPFEFHQGDALELLPQLLVDRQFAAVHASPPCQDHSSLSSVAGLHGTGWLLEATLAQFDQLDVPWVVENVVGPSVTMNGWWFMLCGSMFGLRVRRHRRFGASFLVMPPPCDHKTQGTPLGIYGHGGPEEPGVRPSGHHRVAKAASRDWSELMGMPWASPVEVGQAIPPAYTEFIGVQLLTVCSQ